MFINISKLILNTKMIIKRYASVDLHLSLSVMFNSNKYLICNFYEHPNGNFGDDLNPWMLSRMTGKKIANARKVFNFLGKKEFFFIGSILGVSFFRKIIVIGSGLMDSKNKIKYSSKSKFLWVRGPLTRQKLIECGFNCSKLFGDAAILLPLLVSPIRSEKYLLGIIPHYLDLDSNFISKMSKYNNCLIINVSDDVETVISNIASCKMIVSSSLHGLIVSDTYGIPSRWVLISNEVPGHGFKFLDYLLSVNKAIQEPFLVDDTTTLTDLINLFNNIDNPKIDYYAMLDALPTEFERFVDSAKSILIEKLYT